MPTLPSEHHPSLRLWTDGEQRTLHHHGASSWQVLSEVIKEGGLGLFEVVHIGLSLAEALTEAHDQGIIHRDIKPDNVHIEDKVWDNRFCQNSRLWDCPRDRTILRISVPTLRFGTPLYMSPEQILGKSTDARTDIYMLGALLFECLTGTPIHRQNGG